VVATDHATDRKARIMGGGVQMREQVDRMVLAGFPTDAIERVVLREELRDAIGSGFVACKRLTGRTIKSWRI
jgi:hypothetical protein